MVYPALGMRSADVSNVFRGRQARARNRLAVLRDKELRAGAERRNRLATMMPRVMGAQGAAFDQGVADVSGIDPELGMRLAEFRRGADKGQWDRAVEEASYWRDLAVAVQKMPPAHREGGWRVALGRARQMGLDISKAPQDYDPRAVAMTAAIGTELPKSGKPFEVGLPGGGRGYAQTDQGGGVRRPPGVAPPEKEEKSLALERKLRLAGIDPQSGEGQKYIRADLAGQRISFEAGPDGVTRVSIGKGVDGSGAAMEKKTKGTIEDKLLGTRERLARLMDVGALFKAEYQEIGTRLHAAWASLKAKAGFGLPEEDKALLRGFADYRGTAIENINAYIKEITGVQMSEAEANHLRQGMPDPGEGVFDGDDPITFKAKVGSVMRAAIKARARYAYYLKQGITDVDAMARESPLTEVPLAINPDTGQRLIKIKGNWVKA